MSKKFWEAPIAPQRLLIIANFIMKIPSENRKLAALLLLSRQVLNWTRKISRPFEVDDKNVEIAVEWHADNFSEFSDISECHIHFI
jgi:hypothetical protein